MANTIKIKRNSTGTPSSLAAGELAVNTANGNLWVGNTAGNGVIHLNPSVSTSYLPLVGGTLSGTLNAAGIIASSSVSAVGLTTSSGFTLTSGDTYFQGSGGVNFNGGPVSFSATAHISSNVTIKRDNAYNLNLYRPTTGATNASFLSFDLNNDAGTAEQITYGLIGARIVDHTDGSEDGELVFRTMLNGTLATRMTLSQAGNLTTTGTITATSGTLSGNLTLNTRLTFSGGSNQYLEIGTNSIALKASSGSVLWNSANQLSTSGGTLTGALALSTNTTPDTSGGEAFLYKHASNGTVLSGYNASIETGSAGSRAVRLTVGNTGTVTVNNNLTVAGSCTFAALSGTTATFSGQIKTAGGAVSTPSFGFTDETGLGMSRPTSASLNFVTNSTERVRINSTGVGIGASPSQLLHLAKSNSNGLGPVLMLDNTAGGTTDSSAITFASFGNTYHRASITCLTGADPYHGQLIFSTGIGAMSALTERMRITSGEVTINEGSNNVDFRVEGDGDQNLIRTDASNDRVGIKTASPAYTFHCVGTGYFSQAVTMSAALEVSGNGSFGGANDTSAKLFVRGGYADFWNSTNSLLRVSHDGTRAKLQGFTGGAYDAIALNPDGGNVSIGSATPISPLTVDGADGIYVRHTEHAGIAFDDTNIADGSTPITYISGDGGSLVLGRANRNSSTGRRTASAASITISNTGATTLTGGLTVSSGVKNLTGTLGTVSFDAGGNGVFFSRNSTNYIHANGGTSSGLDLGGQHSIVFQTGSSISEKMRLTSAGRLGINQTAPAASIHTHASSGHNSVYITTDGTSSSNAALWFAHNYTASSDWAGIIWGDDNLLRITNSGSSSSNQFVLNESGHVSLNSAGLSGYGHFGVAQPAGTDTDGIAVVNGTNSFRLWVDDAGMRRLNAGSTSVVEFNPSSFNVYKPLTVGANDTGHDVRFWGATANRYWEWDESDDIVRQKDNVKTTFGDGTDLMIWHDGSNSYQQQGSNAGNLNFTYKGGQKFSAIFKKDADSGKVELYYDGSKKFETTSAGATITGSIGINTTSPAQMLSVFNGKISVTDGYNIGSHDGETGMYVDEDNDIRWQVGGSHLMTLQEHGKLGIGISSPSQLLSVEGSRSGEWITKLKNTHSTNGNGLLVQAGDDSAVKVVEFRNLDETGTFTMLGNGNVGINYTPTSRLEVQQSSGNIFKCRGDSNSTRFEVGASGACGIEANSGSPCLTLTNSDSEHLLLSCWGGKAKFKSYEDGFNPVEVLDSSGDQMFNIRQSGNDCIVRIYKDGGSQKVQIHSDGDSYFAGGNLALNSTSPSYLFHCNGDAYVATKMAIATTTDSSYGLKVAGYIASYGHSTWSDQRLKDNTALWDTSEAASLVKDVPVYSYRWNDKCDAKEIQTQDRIGFLANEVEEKINKNNLVITSTDGEKYQSVNTTDMIPILWACLQKVMAELDDAKERILDLENK